MEKGTNKKKTKIGTNTKKSTGTKKAVSKTTAAKKVVPTKKVSAATTKKVAPTQKVSTTAKKVTSVAKVTTSPKKETTITVTNKVTKPTNLKSTVKEDKKIKNAVKENDIVLVKDVDKKSKISLKKEKLLLENNELTNLIKIVLIVTGIFLAFYLVTYLIAKNNAKDDAADTESAEVSIQYDEILISNLLKQSNSEYYVLAYDVEDDYYDAYNTYLTAYASEDDAIRVYTSILTNGFNQKYYDTSVESNTKINSIEELKLNLSSLIQIKDGKINAVFEGHDAIISHLATLTA